MKRAPHPPYSPDLAPSNFYLIGSVMQLLAGQQFPDGEALPGTVNEIYGGLKKLPCKEHFSIGLQGFVNAWTSLETMSTKVSFYVNRVAEYTGSLDMLMVWWNTL
jgi:hypothetical protein